MTNTSMSRLRGMGSGMGICRTIRAAKADEDGFAPLTMMLGLGLLVIPVLLVVLTVPTWEARTVDARDAAANAARALVTANNWADGVAAADQIVSEQTANDGLHPTQITVGYSGTLTPGATVTATVTVTIPAGTIPGIGAFGTVHYTARSTQQVDDYRSDPDGFSNSEGSLAANPSAEVGQ